MKTQRNGSAYSLLLRGGKMVNENLIEAFNEYKIPFVAIYILFIYFLNGSIAKNIGHSEFNPSKHMVALSPCLSLVLFFSKKYNRFNIWLLVSQICLFLISILFLIDIIFLGLKGEYYFYLITGAFFLNLIIMSIDLIFFDKQ